MTRRQRRARLTGAGPLLPAEADRAASHDEAVVDLVEAAAERRVLRGHGADCVGRVLIIAVAAALITVLLVQVQRLVVIHAGEIEHVRHEGGAAVGVQGVEVGVLDELLSPPRVQLYGLLDTLSGQSVVSVQKTGDIDAGHGSVPLRLAVADHKKGSIQGWRGGNKSTTKRHGEIGVLPLQARLLSNIIK